MMKRVRLQILFPFLALAVVLAPLTLMAHLDPPGPPAFQEVIWLTLVTVNDDMDTFGSGELSLSYSVEQATHPPAVTGRIPLAGTVAVATPPAALFPGILPGTPVVLYNHINCNPLERPIKVSFTLDDKDLFGSDTSTFNIRVRQMGAGQFGGGNREFSTNITLGVFPLPQFNGLCAPGTALPPGLTLPPPPSVPSPGPIPLQEIPISMLESDDADGSVVPGTSGTGLLAVLAGTIVVVALLIAVGYRQLKKR